MTPEPVGRAGRVWFATLAAVVAVAFLLQAYLLATGGADANSGETGDGVPVAVRLLRLVSFFTIQSNAFVLVAALLLAVRGTLPGLLGRVVLLDAVLGITVTGAVFGFVLDDALELRGLASVTTALLHYVSPVMTVLGWLLFGPRRAWDLRTAAWAFAWPVLWLAGTALHGALTGWYPYPFLDVGLVGPGGAAAGAGVVVVLGVVVCAVLLLVDARVPAPLARRRPRASRAG